MVYVKMVNRSSSFPEFSLFLDTRETTLGMRLKTDDRVFAIPCGCRPDCDPKLERKLAILNCFKM